MNSEIKKQVWMVVFAMAVVAIIQMAAPGHLLAETEEGPLKFFLCIACLIAGGFVAAGGAATLIATLVASGGGMAFLAGVGAACFADCLEVFDTVI